jgi:hypothetical protein
MMDVRSYRRVFDLERRIYRVDSFRLNPSGIPVRGVVYLLAILMLTLLAARLPLVGAVAARVPWFLRYLALPGLLACLLTVVRIEGRPFHLAARALLRQRTLTINPGGLRAARTDLESARGRRWSPSPVLMLPDGSDGVRRMRYTGPGALLVTVAHRRKAASGPLVALGLRPHVEVRHVPGAARPRTGDVVLLARGARARVS